LSHVKKGVRSSVTGKSLHGGRAADNFQKVSDGCRRLS
jgi:hypothetical protein